LLANLSFLRRTRFASTSIPIGGLAPTGAVLLAALLAACSDDPVPLPKLAPDAVVLAFGDSLTYGTGARDEQSYPAVLAALTGRQVINAGIPGEETDGGLRRLPGLLDRYQPDLLILCHGGNDILRKRDAAVTEANLREMIRIGRERHIPVVMIAVPNVGLFLSSADFYADIAEDMQVPVEDDILATLLGDNRFKSDHVHPNASGYARLAEAMQSLLSAHGAL
jgi:acyl-CoA thioesterase-1